MLNGNNVILKNMDYGDNYNLARVLYLDAVFAEISSKVKIYSYSGKSMSDILSYCKICNGRI